MRLVTRSDFDGLVCAVLLKKVEQIDEIMFAHPKDMQDGKVEITSNDIITNLPYVKGCGMWFDHHSSELDKNSDINAAGRVELAPSTGRVLVNHYGADKFKDYQRMIDDCDKVDSANLNFDEIMNPQGWVLLSYVMDSRTGLGYYHDYRISNYELMMKMIDIMGTKSIEEITADPDVKERLDRYKEHQIKFHAMMRDHSKMYGDCVVTDLRNLIVTATGNRFLIYTIFPESNISLRIIDGKNKENVVFAVGHSILNRTSKVNVGALLSQYGGGGHVGAGTCQVPYADADKVLAEIIEKMNNA
jgi:hypothetical protein